MTNGNNNNNRRRRGNRRRGNPGGGSPPQQQGPTYSVVPHARSAVAITAGTPHTVSMPAQPTHLGVRTHVRYHLMAHQAVNIQIRPSPALSRTLAAYQSGWICVQDWDDVTVTALVNGDLHVTFESRGFVQQ